MRCSETTHELSHYSHYSRRNQRRHHSNLYKIIINCSNIKQRCVYCLTVNETRRSGYFYSSMVPLLYFFSWESKWLPSILTHNSALGLTSLTALLTSASSMEATKSLTTSWSSYRWGTWRTSCWEVFWGIFRFPCPLRSANGLCVYLKTRTTRPQSGQNHPLKTWT